jgi:hypothetical protein
MKKETNKSLGLNTTDPKKHLIEGANILRLNFKTPAKFLNFLTECTYWMESIESEPFDNDKGFFVRMLTNELLQPWMTSEDKDVVIKISDGLEYTNSWFGVDEFNDQICLLLKGLSVSLKKGGIYNDILMEEYLLAINTMFKIGRCFRAYECKTDETTSSKAA